MSTGHFSFGSVDPATETIRLVTKRFSGGLEVSPNGTIYRLASPGEAAYVGEPSKQIDWAWEELLRGLYIDLDGEDAKSVRGHTIQWPGTEKWFSGLNIYHSLHCLNLVRQGFYPDYYAMEGSAEHGSLHADVHVDHCIDYIRQTLQCSADLSPIEWEWNTILNKPMFKADTAHTCRDWTAIDGWARERSFDWKEKRPALSQAHTSSSEAPSKY
ncbi:hypothetical protein NA57DRAFT_74603 [Rhizodiscina lignyota]|uniref:Tat pathway signal sequence n=1 Tax=Rhizodiscina lignyota TaxID=1504668 RepID=A0A9P4IKP2_9PEZI|nr:hypothetical protein NA57DRAFT_74603 [Rhizodiscina lignyota]